MVSHGNNWPSTYPKLVTGRNRSINRQNIEIMNDIGLAWMESCGGFENPFALGG